MYEKQLEIPEGVNIDIEKMKVVVSGAKGTINREFIGVFGVKIEKGEDGKTIKVSTESDIRKQKASVGSIIAHIKNMANGVTEGYTAKLKVIYSHFPVTIKIDDAQNKIFIQNFIGEKTPRVAKIVGEQTKVEVKGADITVTGINVEEVGQTAANMEQATRIRDKDRKVFQDGIFITEKPKGKI